MMAWTAMALAFPAFAALSLGMERHQEQVLGRLLAHRWAWAFRLAGMALLAASLLACLWGQGPSMAVTVWLGVLTFAAMAVGLLLTYAPAALRWLAPWFVLVAGLMAWGL